MTPEEMKGLVDQFLQARLRDNKPWQLHAMLSDFGFWVQAYEREACAELADECVDIEKLSEVIRARGQK